MNKKQQQHRTKIDLLLLFKHTNRTEFRFMISVQNNFGNVFFCFAFGFGFEIHSQIMTEGMRKMAEMKTITTLPKYHRF